MEIIFRAWHKKQRRFYHFNIDTVTRGQRGFYLPIGGISGAMNCELDDSNLYAEKELRTGFQDKNGTPTYAGDKLRDEDGEEGVVRWLKKRGWWEVDFGARGTDLLCDVARHCEVTGHVHEEGRHAD